MYQIQQTKKYTRQVKAKPTNKTRGTVKSQGVKKTVDKKRKGNASSESKKRVITKKPKSVISTDQENQKKVKQEITGDKCSDSSQTDTPGSHFDEGYSLLLLILLLLH